MNASSQYRMQRMGLIGASSTSGTSAGMGGGSTPSVPYSGVPYGADGGSINWGGIAQSAASIANTGRGVVQGVLQAEAAQNAINAQRNLTTALTPGVITIGLAVLAYFLISRK